MKRGEPHVIHLATSCLVHAVYLVARRVSSIHIPFRSHFVHRPFLSLTPDSLRSAEWVMRCESKKPNKSHAFPL